MLHTNQTSFGLIKIKIPRQRKILHNGYRNNRDINLKYYSLDGILKYNLSNSESFQPYLFAGFGFSAFQDGVDRNGLFPSSDVSETSLAGIGLNIGIPFFSASI